MRVDVDLKDWPTSWEAAVQLEIPETTVERLVKQKHLKKRIRRDTGVPVGVIDPDSIAKYRQSHGTQASVALARVERAEVPPARSGSAPSGLEAAFLAFLQSKTPSAGVPVERRIFLTMAEAAEFSGLPVAFLRRLIASGKLKALKTGAGWRVARLELERASETLADTPEDLTEHELRDLEVNRLRRQGIVNSR
jgi:excisionase family DNA binding protein